MAVTLFLLTAVAGYCLGSIPTGFLVGRARGVDMRALGSGNIGATNALRVLGKTAGIVVLAVDVCKGFLACWGLPRVMAFVVPAAAPDHHQHLLAVAAGAGAILGHNYTCWLGFRGGKGVATSAGVLAVLTPMALLLAVAVWGVVFIASRYVSLASISAAAVLPLLVSLTGGKLALIIFTALMAVAVILGHRTNIGRLLNRTEHRFARTASKPEQETLPHKP